MKTQSLVTRWLYGQMRTVLVVKANASDIKTHQQPNPLGLTQFHENTVTAKPERLVTRWLYGQMGTVLVVKANASDIKTHQQPKPIS